MEAKKPADKKTETPAEKKTVPPAEKKPAEQNPVQPKDTGPKLTDITSAYLKKKELFDHQHESLTKRIDSSKANISRIEVMMNKAELQLSQLIEPSIREDLVEPLAKELLKSLPDHNAYQVIGPIGKAEAITISFTGKVVTDEEILSGGKSITLITKMENGGIGVRDYSKDLKQYKPGSIGYASGLNHPVVEVPNNAGIDFLLGWIK